MRCELSVADLLTKPDAAEGRSRPVSVGIPGQKSCSGRSLLNLLQARLH